MIALHVTGKLPTRQPASGFKLRFRVLLLVIPVFFTAYCNRSVVGDQRAIFRAEKGSQCAMQYKLFWMLKYIEECYIILKLYNLVTTSRLVSPTSPKSPFKVIYCVACPLCRRHSLVTIHTGTQCFLDLRQSPPEQQMSPLKKNPLHYHWYRSGKNYNRKQSDTVIKVTFSICRCSKGPQRWA